jgi:hypothetical protein
MDGIEGPRNLDFRFLGLWNGIEGLRNLYYRFLGLWMALKALGVSISDS